MYVEESVSGVGSGTMRQSSFEDGTFCPLQVLHRLGIHLDLGLEELGLGWAIHSLYTPTAALKIGLFQENSCPCVGRFSRSSHMEVCSEPPGEPEVTKPEASKEMMQLGAQSLLEPQLRKLLLFGLGWF